MTRAISAFQPLRWLFNGHLQTLAGSFLSRGALAYNDERHVVELVDGDKLVVFVRRQKTAKSVIYLFHGLGSSVESGYIPHIASVFYKAGHTVVMANQRGCGSGAKLAKHPYHAGRAEDFSQIIAWGRKHFPGSRHTAIGFSLGGNALLLLIGARRHLIQPDYAISVNAPIDLADTAKRISTGLNRIYDLSFVYRARRHLTAQKINLPIRISLLATIREVDHVYTAPLSGFRDENEYYMLSSAKPHLAKITIPTVMITAADDPFVFVDTYKQAALSRSVQLCIEEHGGHLGYIADQVTELGSRHWLDTALLRRVEAFLYNRINE